MKILKICGFTAVVSLVFILLFLPKKTEIPGEEKGSVSIGAVSGFKQSVRVEFDSEKKTVTEVWKSEGVLHEQGKALDLTELYWQTRSEQCFSAGFDLEDIAQNLYDDMENVTLDRESVTAPSDGILEYELLGKPGVFVLRGTGEDAFLGLYYYYTPQSPIVLDGVERTLISYSFHLGMNGYYGLWVEAKSKSDNQNVWRGINYSHPEGQEPFCVKFFPPGSQMTNELYPVLGRLELSEEVLAAWKEKMLSLARSVKPKEFK